MNPVKFNILFFVAIIYVVAAFISKNAILPYAYILIILLYSALDFRLGLAAWAIITPLTGGLETENLFLVYTPIIVAMYYIRLVSGVERIYKSNFKIYLFILIFLTIVAMLLSNYMDYFHVIAIVILIFFISDIISQQIIKREGNIYLIANAFIASALIASFTSFFTSYGDEVKRMALGDNIRELANIVGLGIILLITFYFFKGKTVRDAVTESQYKLFSKVKWLILIVLIGGLISTMSRGVVFAVCLSFGILAIASIVKNIITRNAPLIFRGMIVLVGVLGLGILYGEVFLTNININTELLAERFSGESVEGGTGIRQEIWKAGISGLEGWQILYGHGLSSFKMLATQNGYNYYAHSVFVDTLVTTGILGAGILLLLLVYIIKNIFWLKDYHTLSIFVYMIFAYISHGTMFSQGFWFLMSICVGLVESKRIKNSI